MRRLLVLPLLPLAVLCLAQVPLPPTPADLLQQYWLKDALVYWWVALPQRAAGPTWYDIGGLVPLTLNNMASTHGWKGSAYPDWYREIRFDGTDDYLEDADTSRFNFANGTVTLVIDTANIVAPGASTYLLAKHVVGAADGWIVRYATTGEVTARLYNNAATSAGSRTSVSTALTSGGRHHLAVVLTTDTVTLANNDVALYIDGVLDPTSGRTDDGAGPYSPCNTCTFRVGSSTDGFSGAFVNGAILSLAVYNRALTATEIARLAKGPDAMIVGRSLDPALLTPSALAPIIRRRVTIQ